MQTLFSRLLMILGAVNPLFVPVLAICQKRLRSNEGIHVLGRRNGGCSAMGLTAGPGRAIEWWIGVAIERDEACAIANHSLEPALANSAPAHLLQSFWLLSEHWACAAEPSKQACVFQHNLL